MKYFLLLFVLFLFSGCSTKSQKDVHFIPKADYMILERPINKIDDLKKSSPPAQVVLAYVQTVHDLNNYIDYLLAVLETSNQYGEIILPHKPN